MPPSNRPLQTGTRVVLRHVQPEDENAFCEAARRSRKLHGPWVSAPRTSEEFDSYLKRCRQEDFEGLLVVDRETDRLAGVYNISQIFRGHFQNAYLGYYGFEPFAGAGLMSEGLGLVLRYLFTTLKLHRLEANIQPGNRESIALVRRGRFRLEGLSPRYLKIGGRWRDHERWAIVREEWNGQMEL